MPKAEKLAALAVRRRLLEVVREHYGTQSAFLVAWPGVRPTTWKEWVHQTTPRLPNADFLVQLAQRHRVSLNWLLLGVEPQYYRRLQRLTTPDAEVRRMARALGDTERENARLLQRLQRAPRKPRRASARKRASQRRRKA